MDIKGTFHLEKGYYYFRNIDNRILFGGGRNLDFEGETTTELDTTELIQNRLEKIVKTVILQILLTKLNTDGVVLWVLEITKTYCRTTFQSCFIVVRSNGRYGRSNEGSLIGKN